MPAQQPVVPDPALPVRLYTPAYALLCLAHLLVATACFGFVLLPRHIRALGGTPLDIGLLAATSGIAGIAIRLVTGQMADARGRRFVFFLGGVVGTAGFFFYPLLESTGLSYHTVRALHSLGLGSLFATFFTYAADISPGDRRTEGIAIFGVTGMLGGAIGPWLGELLLAHNDFTLFFHTLAAFSGLSLLITLALPETRPSHHPQPERVPLESLLTHVDLRMTWIVTALFGYGVGTIFTFLEPLVSTRGLGSVTPYMVVYSASAIALRTLARRVPDRLGTHRILPASLAFTLGSAALLTFVESDPGLVLAGLLGGLGHGFGFPILARMAADRGGSANHGGSIALFTIFHDVGVVAAGPIGGLAIGLAGHGSPFLLAALAVGAGVLCCRSDPSSRRA